jgi:LmbE family N-acetylglucosaminyl deacetylase
VLVKRRHFVAAAPLGWSARPPEGSSTMAAAKSQAKILAVSAHPADFCSRAGGTLIKHARAGSKVKVIWLTHGEHDESELLFKQRPGISLDEVRRIREKEAFACAQLIGAEGRMFGFGDGPLKMTPERMDMLAREMADFKPDIILTHWKDELTYPTHWLTAQSVIQAAQMARVSGTFVSSSRTSAPPPASGSCPIITWTSATSSNRRSRRSRSSKPSRTWSATTLPAASGGASKSAGATRKPSCAGPRSRRS